MDNNQQKYNVALKFVNKLLESIQGEDYKEIHDLKEFKNIDRVDIIKEGNEQIITDMSDEIFAVFSKYALGYYRRNKIKIYILTFIRYMCKDIGLQFLYANKSYHENNMSKNKCLYYIK